MTPTAAGATPDLSVVVPSVSGWADLRESVAALSRQRDAEVQTVVADRVGEPVRERLRAEFPSVSLVEAATGSSIPALRRLALGVASAPVVGVIEDHVIVPPDWAARMLAAHREGAEVVGGAVVNGATGSLVDRAAFLCEYARCLAPAAGPVERLPGNNVTYRRALLDRFAAVIAEDGWEDRLHAAMRAGGVVLLSRPDVVVTHRQRTTIGRYARQRFWYSRSYAGARARNAGALHRLVLGAAAAALPPLLLGRIARAAWAAPGHRRDLLASLPLLAAWVCVWAYGETAGAWFGPGDAMSKVA